MRHGLLLGTVSTALLFVAAAAASASPLRFARAPFVGVSCPAANVTTCGRVGIAVWLARRGASEVVVSLAGAHVRLSPPARRSPSPSWRGFVRLPLTGMGLPARWDGEPAKTLVLEVLARYRRTWLTRTLVVPLSPGWG